MSPRTLMLASLMLAGVLPAQGPPENDLLRSVDHVLGRGDRAPTIDETLGDTLLKLRGVDALGMRAAAGRLRETDAELRLYETLLRQVRAGLLVEVPRGAASGAPGSADDLALERKKVEDLARQLADAENDVSRRAAESRSAPAAPSRRGTAIADAMLDVLVDVPKAPEGPARRPAVDPANLSRALFQAGDFAGTLEALDQIPPGMTTPEQQLRRARALDQLGRTNEARSAYEAVAASEKDGPYGRQAAWMLKLARTREQVAGAVAKADSRPTQGEKKK